jgi:hypothetical protein
MIRVGFEPTTPVSEQEKTVNVLDHAVTMIGVRWVYLYEFVNSYYDYYFLPTNLSHSYSYRRYHHYLLVSRLSLIVSYFSCSHDNLYNKKSYPCNRPWRPIGLWDVGAPTFSLDSRLTDGGKVVSLTRRPPFSPQEDSWYSFLLEAESPQGHSAAGRIR